MEYKTDILLASCYQKKKSCWWSDLLMERERLREGSLAVFLNCQFSVRQTEPWFYKRNTNLKWCDLLVQISNEKRNPDFVLRKCAMGFLCSWTICAVCFVLYFVARLIFWKNGLILNFSLKIKSTKSIFLY